MTVGHIRTLAILRLRAGAIRNLDVTSIVASILRPLVAILRRPAV